MALPTLALFIVSLGYGVVVPLLPELAGSEVAVSSGGLLSVVYIAYSASKICAQLPGGVWVDRAGPRRVLLVGLALFCVSLAGFLHRGGVGWFALVRALEGAATGLVYPAVFAAVVAASPPERSGRRIGVAVGLGTSGLLLGPALGGWLGPRDPRLPLGVALVAAVVVTGVAALAPFPSRARPTVPRTLPAELSALGAVARDLGFLGLLLPIAFNKLTFSAFQGLLPLYGPRFLSLDVRGVTGLFVLTGVCFGVAQALGGVLADRFAPRAVVWAFTAPLLGALGVMAAARTALPFTLGYAGYVCASSILFTATLKHAARVYGTEDTHGGVFGLLATLTDLATVLGPALFLNLYDFSPRATFVAMAILGVPFAVGFFATSRRRDRRTPG